MNYWAGFWGAALLFAGVAFAVITVIVSYKGMADLRYMVTGLRKDMAEIDAAKHAKDSKIK